MGKRGLEFLGPILFQNQIKNISLKKKHFTQNRYGSFNAHFMDAYP